MFYLQLRYFNSPFHSSRIRNWPNELCLISKLCDFLGLVLAFFPILQKEGPIKRQIIPDFLKCSIQNQLDESNLIRAEFFTFCASFFSLYLERALEKRPPPPFKILDVKWASQIALDLYTIVLQISRLPVLESKNMGGAAITSASSQCEFWIYNELNELGSIRAHLCCKVYVLCSSPSRNIMGFQSGVSPQSEFSDQSVCTGLFHTASRVDMFHVLLARFLPEDFR